MRPQNPFSTRSILTILYTSFTSFIYSDLYNEKCSLEWCQKVDMISNCIPQNLRRTTHPLSSTHVNKDNLSESFSIRLLSSGGADAPVRGVGPICTVTSSLVPCLQQEVELGQTGLGYYPPGRTCARVLKVWEWVGHPGWLEQGGNARACCWGMCTGASSR